MAKAKGGGITGKNVIRPGVRTGQPAREMRPAGVSQIGSSMGNHATQTGKVLRGAVEPIAGRAKPSVPLGNDVALNVGKGGPGAGRTLYGQSGTQGQYGSVSGSPRPAGRSFDAPPPNSKREY
jgi:hypothetical protein